MATVTQYKARNFQGSGTVYFNGIDVGNVKEVGITTQTEKKEIRNYRNVNGGNIYSNEKLKAVEASLTLLDWNEENMQIALRGNVIKHATEAFTDVVKTGVAGRLCMLDRAATFTSIQFEDAGTYRPAVEGTDYERNAAGIKALSDGDFKFTGTYLASTDVHALTQAAETFEVTCVIENSYVPGEIRVVKFHKFSCAPLAAMAVIGEEDAEMQLKGEVLADATKPAGESQFFYTSISNKL